MYVETLISNEPGLDTASTMKELFIKLFIKVYFLFFSKMIGAFQKISEFKCQTKYDMSNFILFLFSSCFNFVYDKMHSQGKLLNFGNKIQLIITKKIKNNKIGNNGHFILRSNSHY